MVRRWHLLSCAVLGALGVGCGTASDDTGGVSTTIAPVATIGGVGAIPVTREVSDPLAPRTTTDTEGGAQLIGEVAGGNRLLALGDSILASTSSRYGNQMCETLVPLGWQVAVEAEPSRFIEFGNAVLDRVLRNGVAPSDDWNAAVVFLGSNYRGDALEYESQLRRIVDRLEPRPILLLTVTEYRPEWSEVNEVVVRLADEHDHVTLLDWKTISEEPGVLSGDRLHPTQAGRQALADSVAGKLGQVSSVGGTCMRSVFRDDSAVGDDAPAVLGPPSTSSTGSNGGGSGGGGSSGGGSSGGGSEPVTTPATVTTQPPAPEPTLPPAPEPTQPPAPEPTTTTTSSTTTTP